MEITKSLIFLIIIQIFLNSIPNSYCQEKAIPDENQAIKYLLLNYIDAIEKENYKDIENYLTDDYEYYSIARRESNRKQYIKILERNQKKYGNIRVIIANIEIFPDAKTPHDLKVIYYQTTFKNNHVNWLIKTVRVFKGEETKNKWKIYREFDDVFPKRNQAYSYYPETKKKEEETIYEVHSFWTTLFMIGDILCFTITLSLAGVIIFIFYQSIRLYIFRR